MLHTEPSFCVYADEDGLVVDNEKGDLKVKQGTADFTFANTMLENHEQDPSNPVFLKNHAQLLQSNGDLNGAEEYYFRATMADPKDGESLMQYAKLVWELHHDQDRALAYFENAVHAAPNNCDVLAAYARFLWEVDEEEDDKATALFEESRHVAAGLGVDFVGLNSIGDLEEYYKTMVNKNCCDPLILGNYARFLQQIKGDLAGAEEYYLRAVQANPEDGEVISQYAQLVWELHRDQVKALSYFEQAVKAAPTDSHVLAAYAKFLWEAEVDEDGDQLQPSLLQGLI